MGEWWSRLASGMATRGAAHVWAAQWVERGNVQFDDSMVLTGLQYLHGYDMVYDADSGRIVHSGEYGGPFIKSEAEIGDDLERWIANCRIYDADPEGYRAIMRRKALESLMDENDKGHIR